jgi:regulator of ribonuclease activity A
MDEGTDGTNQVLVVDAGHSMRCAVAGDLIVKAAADNGWNGLIVAGCVRDAAELAKLPIGVLALGTTPRKSVRRGEGQVNIDVLIGNVRVSPGDLVYADADGVLFLDKETSGEEEPQDDPAI